MPEMDKITKYETLQWAWMMLRECETLEEGRDRIHAILKRIADGEDVDFRPGIDRMMNLDRENMERLGIGVKNGKIQV